MYFPSVWSPINNPLHDQTGNSIFNQLLTSSQDNYELRQLYNSGGNFPDIS